MHVPPHHRLQLIGCDPLHFLPTLPASVPTQVQARYVELLVQIRSQARLRQEKAGLSLMGAQGVQLHAEGGNDARERRLQKACAALETKLEIPIGGCCRLACLIAVLLCQPADWPTCTVRYLHAPWVAYCPLCCLPAPASALALFFDGKCTNQP